MTAQNKSTQKPADASRFERITNGLVEAMKQLKSTIEKTKSTMNPAMLREQTLTNVNVILDLYKKGRPPGKSAPSIIIADDEKNTKQVYAAVVRTRYDSEVGLTDLYMSIQGPSCNSDVQALEELYKLSRAAMRRAIIMTMNEDGFTDWDDLDLP